MTHTQSSAVRETTTQKKAHTHASEYKQRSHNFFRGNRTGGAVCPPVGLRRSSSQNGARDPVRIRPSVRSFAHIHIMIMSPGHQSNAYYIVIMWLNGMGGSTGAAANGTHAQTDPTQLNIQYRNI